LSIPTTTEGFEGDKLAIEILLAILEQNDLSSPSSVSCTDYTSDNEGRRSSDRSDDSCGDEEFENRYESPSPRFFKEVYDSDEDDIETVYDDYQDGNGVELTNQ
jgi:hypothetical protein